MDDHFHYKSRINSTPRTQLLSVCLLLLMIYLHTTDYYDHVRPRKADSPYDTKFLKIGQQENDDLSNLFSDLHEIMLKSATPCATTISFWCIYK